MRPSLLLLSLLLLPAHGFFLLHTQRQLPSTLHSTAASSSLPSITNVTIQVPQRCFHDDDDDYPSPLHTIRIESMLTDEEAKTCYNLALAYGKDQWDQPDAERHTNYYTCDFVVEDATELDTYLQETVGFQERMWRRLSQQYNVEEKDLMGYIDFFCVNYVAAQDDDDDNAIETMDRLEAHRDGSILSFTVLLSPPDEFEGGGTTFDCLEDVETDNDVLHPGGVVRPQRAGDAVLHSGKLLHGADIVTQGQRVVLVGFVDVADWCIAPGVMAQACTEWGRLDVAKNRYKQQQQERITNNNKYSSAGWPARCTKFLPPTSCLNTYIPAFTETVKQRADADYQRRKRLEAEDRMLRTILYKEKPAWRTVVEESDITVL